MIPVPPTVIPDVFMFPLLFYSRILHGAREMASRQFAFFHLHSKFKANLFSTRSQEEQEQTMMIDALRVTLCVVTVLWSVVAINLNEIQDNHEDLINVIIAGVIAALIIGFVYSDSSTAAHAKRQQQSLQRKIINRILVRGEHNEESLLCKLISIAGVTVNAFRMHQVIQDRHSKDENVSVSDEVFAVNVVTLTLMVMISFLVICFNRERDYDIEDSIGGSGASIAPRESSIGFADSSTAPLLLNESLGNFQTPNLQQSQQSHPQPPQKRISIEWNAGLYSRLFFVWVGNLIFAGYSRVLEKSDFPFLRDDDDIQKLELKFERAWTQAKKEEESRLREIAGLDGEFIKDGKVKDDGKRPYLLVKALHRAGILTPFYRAAILKLLYDTSVFLSPQLLKRMIHYLLNKDPTGDEAEGYNIALIMFLNATFSTIILHQYFHLVFRAGMRVRTVLVTALYRKSLKLSITSRSQNDLGATVTYMSNDAQQLQDIFPYLHVVWSSPLQIFYAMFFLWREIQYSSLFCIAVIFFFVTPLTAILTVKTRAVQGEVMGLRSKRVGLTGEMLGFMKTLKIYAWDFVFRDRVLEARNVELNRFRDYIYLNSIGRMLWFGTPALVTLSTLAGYVALGGQLDPETAWTTISLLGLLRFPLAQLPNIFQGAIAASVSMRRIEKFLLCPELQSELTNEVSPPLKADGRPASAATIPRVISRETLMSPYPTAIIEPDAAPTTENEMDIPPIKSSSRVNSEENISGAANYHHVISHPTRGGYAIEVANGNFFWDDDRKVAACTGIDFRAPEGNLVIVMGEVGSGKSALIYSLIGDLQPSLESPPYVAVNGSVAYAAQVPWIQNATVRDNILFGSPYEDAWYKKVVHACALEADFEQLPNGDLTEIGERGINLSGGQKARISLARAVYSRSDILLLESCFEAVDEHVGAHLWNNCFQGILKSQPSIAGRPRTVVLVTHSLKNLAHADKILVMKKGAIHMKGHYSSLISSPEFKSLLNDVQAKRDKAVSTDGDATTDASAAASASESAKGEMTRQESSGSVLTATSPGQQKHQSEDQAKKKADPKEKKGDLIMAEDRAVGQVSAEIYRTYLNKMGGVPVGLILLFMLVLKTALDLITSRWLAHWSSQQTDSSKGVTQESVLFASMAFPAIRPVPMLDEWMSVAAEETESSAHHSTAYYLGIYAALSIALILVTSLGSLMASLFALRASKSSHMELISAIARSPSSFFDTTPVGRILNRCQKDIQAIDDMLPMSVFTFLALIVDIMGLMLMIAIVIPYFLLVLPVLFVSYMMIQRLYIASSRELKRMESILRSPIFSNFGETLDGASSIRAYRCEDRFIVKNRDLLDDNLRAYYGSIASNRWLAVRLESISNVLILVTAMFVVKEGDINASIAGLILSYVLNVAQSLNWTVRMMSEVETNIVSVERVDEYAKLPPEAPETMPNEPPANWPSEGRIVIKKLRARYRENLEDVIKGISMTIRPGEKIGIAGRTGSGKSTLLLILLRIIEPSGGSIEIDGIDTQTVGLRRLRSSIAIIPQDPILFAGTLRFNLDPLGTHADAEMWNALQIAHLDEHVRSLEKGLDSVITEGGSNFSFGQRQLLTVARALIRNSKILLLDEATSGIDFETDQAVQQTLRRKEFKTCTTMTIAHRLETILDSDRVAFMESGKIVEMDSPSALLKNQNGSFYSLVASMKKSSHDHGAASASASTVTPPPPPSNL